VDKPVIEYPCRWSYTVIGEGREVVAESIKIVLENETFYLEEANRSRHGKYYSFRVAVEVASQSERDRIFATLQDLRSVRVVL